MDTSLFQTAIDSAFCLDSKLERSTLIGLRWFELFSQVRALDRAFYTKIFISLCPVGLGFIASMHSLQEEINERPNTWRQRFFTFKSRTITVKEFLKFLSFLIKLGIIYSKLIPLFVHTKPGKHSIFYKYKSEILKIYINRN